MSSYQEFIKEIKKINGPRKHTLTNSNGVVEAYHYYRINRPQEKKFYLSRDSYLKIIRTVNNYLREALIQGEAIKLPYGMGAIEIQKSKKAVTFKDGKIHNNLPIDWESTLKLWYENPEYKKTKTLIRQDVPYIYTVAYSKVNVKYKNRKYYSFNVNRTIKVALKNQIKNNKIEAFVHGKQLY